MNKMIENIRHFAIKGDLTNA